MPVPPPVLSIIVVSYNTKAMTLACLDSIAAQTRDVDHEIIVVDNASTDGSPEAIADHPSRPRLIASRENLGFARANNLAALQAEGELLLLLNPDTVVLDRAIDRLVAFAGRRPEAMIWGGRTVFADGRLNPSSAWGKMTLWRLTCRALGLSGLLKQWACFNGEAIAGWQRDSERNVDIVSGCLLLISRPFWQRLGGFDPLFYMYGEEADLCLRAIQLGARPRVTPAATIIHYGGASEVTREGKMVRLLAAKSSLICRHFPRWAVAPGLLMHAAWPLSRAIACGLIHRVTGRAAAGDAAATWWAIWHRRNEWRRGYPDIAEAPSPSAVAATAG